MPPPRGFASGVPCTAANLVRPTTKAAPGGWRGVQHHYTHPLSVHSSLLRQNASLSHEASGWQRQPRAMREPLSPLFVRLMAAEPLRKQRLSRSLLKVLGLAEMGLRV